jgi:membrane fusion protein (multidrug efflux system)
MPSFARTFRTLEAEPEARSRLAIVAAIAVLVAWGAWFVLARVNVYATSASARVEVARATQPVDAPTTGRVVKVNVALDQAVKAGDVLVELDDEGERLALAEAKARVDGLGPQVEATRAQMAAEQRALGDLGGTSSAAVAESSAKLREAAVSTALAEEEARRVEKLHESGSVSDIDAMRARADADKKAASEAAARNEITKMRRQYRTDHDDRRTRIASLALEAAKLEAELATQKAKIVTLTHDIERRRVVAPGDGRVGEIGNVRPGSVLKEGERIATIVSSGDLRIVGQYVPAEALGRVAPGQTARVRLEGFPWTEYGEVIARVTFVAREVRDGMARVELEVVKASPRIPLQHGLPATVQVEIERASPMELVLRAAGRLVTGQQHAPAPAASAASGPQASGG